MDSRRGLRGRASRRARLSMERARRYAADSGRERRRRTRAGRDPRGRKAIRNGAGVHREPRCAMRRAFELRSAGTARMRSLGGAHWCAPPLSRRMPRRERGHRDDGRCALRGWHLPWRDHRPRSRPDAARTGRAHGALAIATRCRALLSEQHRGCDRERRTWRSSPICC